MEPDEDLDVSDLRTRKPGESDVDPYEDTDVEDLPNWWATAVREHEEHDLRPYQPPRFEDGTLKYEVVEELEDEHGIDITLKGVGVTYGDDWTILVDGEEVSDVERRRDVSGYSVFEIESEEFISLIEGHLENPNGTE